jgi:LysR family transcriptional regulator, hydrogen peroxide-inducible genes activator
MITTRQLRYFEALARYGHFGKAAEAVGISQPALSIQIRDLEALLGGQLVERGPTEQRLTALGEEVAGRAAVILAGLRDLEDLAHSRGEPLSGPLGLGVIPSVAPFLLPRLLPALADRHPHLRLTLREAVTAALVTELREGMVDAIVVSLPTDEPALAEAVVLEDRFFLAVPANSPLAGRDEISPEEVDAGDLLLLADGHCLRDQALSVCGVIDQRRLRGFGATSLTTLLQLVAAGQGVTLLPELAADFMVRSDDRIRLIRFREPQPGRRIGIAWRKGSPRTRDFTALVGVVSSIAA